MKKTNLKLTGNYWNDKRDFFEKHKAADWKVYTSGMVNNSYHKEYFFTDGAAFWEVNQIVTETVKTAGTLHGITVEAETDITFFKTEYWTTEDACSRYYYEKA